MRVNVSEAFDDLYAAMPGRGDEAELHVSDLIDCARAVWARRNDKPLLGFNSDTRRKFAFGFEFEAMVGEALRAKHGADDVVAPPARLITLRNGAYDSFPKTDSSLLEAEKSGFPYMTGHPDLAIVKDGVMQSIIEVKSTTFSPRTINGKRVRVPPTEAKLHYRIQAAAYALGLGVKQFCIVTGCRDSGMMVEHWYNTKDYQETVTQHLLERIKTTRKGDAMPPARPPESTKSWRCSYCQFVDCEKNVNPQALEVL